MKRSAPLQRRTPLKSTGELKRTPLKPRSKKMAEVYRKERIPLVVRILAERPFCELGPRFRMVDPNYGGCTHEATCVDEIVRRSAGGSIVDESNCRASCWNCNQHKENEPLLARKAGVARRRGDSEW